VDHAQEAAPSRALLEHGQRRQLQAEMVGRHALAVLEIELPADIGPVEELPQDLRDRSGLQAFGFVPVERGAGRALDRLIEAAVVRADLKAAVSIPPDDRCRDGQRVEQAGIVRNREMRSRARIWRSPSGRAANCSLHEPSYAAEELIRSIQ